MGNLTTFNLNKYIRKYGSTVFVETGLGGGGGLEYASSFGFEKLYSTEIDQNAIEVFARNYSGKIQNPQRISLIQGASHLVLDQLLPMLGNAESIIFWLDAHFPGETSGVAYDYEKDLDLRLPLEKELEAINKHRAYKNDIIFIDDMRLYYKDKYEDGSLEDLKLSHIAKYKHNLEFLLSRFEVYKINLDTGYLVCLPKKNRKFGIRMDGNQHEIESVIKKYVTDNYMLVEYVPDLSKKFKYLEIGAAGAVTMKSIYEIVKECFPPHFNDSFEILGLDLPNGWSLDMNSISKFEHPLGIYRDGLPMENTDRNANAKIYLESNPRKWISRLENESIDICFIDGCHGAPCVKADFEAIKSKIKKGGIIFFHDAGEPEQGTDWQGHCDEFINVRQALKDLELFNTGPEWEFLFETQGTRKIGGDGNSCVFIKKIA